MLPHTVTTLENGQVMLHIELAANAVMPILQVFSSMADLARSIVSKTHTAISPERIKEQRQKNDEYFHQLTDAIIREFIVNYDNTQSVTQSISLTNKAIKPLYPNSCYDSVKQILAKNGHLKNKNYNIKK